MKLLWEAMHRSAAEAGLRVVPLKPPGNDMHRQKAPSVAPPEDIPVLQSESGPRFPWEPIPSDNDPAVPSSASAPGPGKSVAPVAPAATSPTSSGAPPSCAPSPAPAPKPKPAAAPTPTPAAVPALVCKGSKPCRGQDEWRVLMKWLHLCPVANTHGKGGPLLSPHSKCATKYLVRDYAKRSEAWWGMFIEVWDRFMEEV